MDNEYKPTRLRTILCRHVEKLNPNAGYKDIDALENDIKTFVRSIVHGANELGLKVEMTDYIGDMD